LTLEECRRALGAGRDATLEELKEARRRLLLRYHPDHNPDRVEWAEQQTRRILEAYDRLSTRVAPPADLPGSPSVGVDRLRRIVQRRAEARTAAARGTRPGGPGASHSSSGRPPAATEVPFVLFGARDKTFALPISSVVEVVQADFERVDVTLSREPRHPSVVGRLRFRDTFIPVIDLSFALDMGPLNDDCHHVVVVDARGARVAVAVERVREVTSVRPSAIEPPAPDIGRLGDCVRGVFARHGEVVYVPHVEALAALAL